MTHEKLADAAELIRAHDPSTKPRQTATTRHSDKLGGDDPQHPGDMMPDPPSVILQAKPAAKAKRHIAGSTDVRVDMTIGMSAVAALSTTEDLDTRLRITKAVMDAVKPRNELEGMLAAQMIGAHAAAMEAYGRAARTDLIANLDTYLNQASKASRTYVTLLEALDRRRGKGGQQKVRVEHVHVYEGGQAIVGAIEGPGGGRGSKRNRSLPHAQPAALAHAPQPPMRCQDAEREPVPIARDDERPLPDARWPEPRRAVG